MQRSDIAIVGAGILGLAHAYHAVRKGLTVSVFERDRFANGATTRNFGMLALIAQSEGKQKDSALRNLKCWQEVAALANINLLHSGCLIVAKHPEEMNVLVEFNKLHRSDKACEFIPTPEKLLNYATAVQKNNVLGGLWSTNAWKIDQRHAPAQLANWLAEKHGVKFHYDTEVCNIDLPTIETNTGSFGCNRAIMRTVPQPNNWVLGPFILGGLSLSRYDAFADCTAIDELKQFQQSHYPTELARGIHVIACQEADGSVTLGDSHKYCESVSANRVRRSRSDGQAFMLTRRTAKC